MSTMSQPFFSSRKWIKVWINEWREGTLRWQATDSQRAFWIDLLALAGRSRYPGIVCAGKDDNRIIGYPATFLSPNSGITSDNIAATLDMFRSKGMVSYQVSQSVNGENLYAVTITNWKKYQSDYEANRVYQRTYRERKKARSASTGGLTSQLGARKSLEEDLDKEKEEETPLRVNGLGSPEFKAFLQAYPIKTSPKAALHEWVKRRLDSRASEVMLSLSKWKACERWQDQQYVPYPAKWLSDQWQSEPVKGVSKHEQKREVTKSAAARLRGEIENH